MMRTRNRKKERGVSLVLSILALMLLSAIAVGMVFMASTETSINSNFKSAETSYFAARAGIEEVRDRMLTINPNTINALLPATMPPAAGSILYVLNGSTAAQIMDLTTPYGDDDLCHDWGNPSAIPGLTWVPANARCSNPPPAGFAITPSVAPFPLDYKWVRVTLKRNDSAAYPAPYNRVDAAQPAGNQVCWNGISEVVRDPALYPTCAAMIPTANPVYMLTALAVTQSGSRRLMKQEIAQTPPPTPPGGLYATGTGCGALSISGGTKTGSFTSAAENPPTDPPSNQTNTNGDVGANGNINLGSNSTTVNGSVSTNLSPTVGACPANGITVNGTPTYGSTVGLTAPYTPPVPPMPNPLPPQTKYSCNGCSLKPGPYGNVVIKGNATIAGGTPGNPAVYTMNSLSFNGQGSLDINPPGPVVINFAGVGQNTVIDMTGGSFSNSTYVPSNFVLNYGGTDKIIVNGGTASYAVINAPNAPVTLNGNGTFYGQIVGNTIAVTGGANFYWDTSAFAPAPNTNSYFEISMRELSY